MRFPQKTVAGIFLVLTTLLTGQLQAGGTSENLILVVNAESASSMKIANHYIQWRNIPPTNVIYLKKISKSDSVNVEIFRNTMLKPILAAIKKRKLENQVDYIVYSSGFPTRVVVNKDVDLDPRADQIKKNRILKLILSTTAMTYYLEMVKEKQLGYLALDGNWYYRGKVSEASLFRKPFAGRIQLDYQVGLNAFRQKKYQDALDAFEVLQKTYDAHFVLSYMIARCHAQLGDAVLAAEALNQSAALGGPTKDFVANDKNFDGIKDNSAFKAVVAQLPTDSFDYLPSTGFRSRYAWQPNGAVIKRGNHTGRKFYLSTMLAATQPPLGNSDDEALAYLKAAVEADATSPKGKFYFTKTGDVRSKTRLRNFPDAINELARLGYRSEIVESILPGRKQDVLGCSIGTSKFDWSKSKSKILPGAICDNLTSYGGVIRKGNKQTPLTELLRYGAAGSSGTTCEPYAIQAKFPHPMIHVHYARGCTLAEAFYQSVHGPFQLLIVGDPLCQPFAKLPEFTTEGLEDNETISGRVSITVTPENDQDSISHFELFSDGIYRANLPVGQKVAFDSRQLSDGYHELRIVAVADHRLETRSRKVIPFLVNNSARQVKVSTSRRKIKLGQPVNITLQSKGADKIDVYQNGRRIGGIQGSSGKVSYSSSLLGEGHSALYAVASFGDAKVASPRWKIQVAR